MARGGSKKCSRRRRNREADKFGKNKKKSNATSKKPTKKRRCAKPFAMSQPVKDICAYLSGLGFAFETERTFRGLINPKSNQQLYFDFWVPELNLLIEYDGCHHYMPSPATTNKQRAINESKFLSTQYRDEVKNDYCESRGRYLLRIPHDMRRYALDMIEEAAVEILMSGSRKNRRSVPRV